MKNIFRVTVFTFLLGALILISSCKKEFVNPTELCDCFVFTKMTFADIMQSDARYRTIENEHFYTLIQSYLDNKEERKHLTELIKSKADRNYEYIHSLLKTNRRNEDDTVVIYVPNYDHANFDLNPIFAIAEILDDSISGGEDRIWGAYIDEEDNDEIKYIILDEDHARNTSRPVFIFDTRFITALQSIPPVTNPVEGGQAQAATGDKYFISYVKSFVDLDNDNRMEIRYGFAIWSNYQWKYTLTKYPYDNLYIYDNQIGQAVTTWKNIPHLITQPGSNLIEHPEFPFFMDHYASMIIYDHDWPASIKYHYLYPPSPYTQSIYYPDNKVRFDLRMTNNSNMLIAWQNVRLSDIPNGWYLPVHNCPNGWFGIYHYN